MTNRNDYMTWQQGAEIARHLMDLKKAQRKSTRAAADLRHAALDGARLPIKDADGNTTGYLGSGPFGVEHVGGPTPNRPAAPFVDVGQRVVKVQHSGLDANSDPAADNVTRAEVHVSQDQLFEPSLGTFAVSLDSVNGSVTHSLSAGEWYVGVVWVSLSGKRSPMSETVLADIEPPVDAQDIEDTLEEAQERIDEARREADERFEALDEGFEEHSTSIDDARDRLKTAEGVLAPLPGLIEASEQEVGEAKDAAVKAGAAAAEANNRSMTRLANGNFEQGLDYWAGTNLELTEDAHSGVQAAEIGSVTPASSMPVVAGQIWELSFYHKGEVDAVFQAVAADDARTTLESRTVTGTQWADSGVIRLEVPEGVDLLSFTLSGVDARVDDIALRDVTDVVRLEEAATAARKRADTAIAETELLKLAVDGEGGLADRLGSAETVLAEKADSSALPDLEQRLETAFGTGISDALEAAATDAQERADAAQSAAETEARRVAEAEAQAAQSAAESTAAADALEKAEAARDEAISSSATDAQEKADAAQQAAETAAAADAKAKADQARADAISAAASDAQTKADQAKADAIAAAEAVATEKANAARDEAISTAASDAQTKADAAQQAAENALNEYALEAQNLVRNGSFERGFEHWGTSAGEVVESGDAHSGEYVLAAGDTAVNQYPRSNWVATEPGRTYLIDYWAKKLPGGDDPRYLRIYAQVELQDGSIKGHYATARNGSTFPITPDEMPEGQWVRVEGLITVTQPGATKIRFSPHVTATGYRYHIDSVRAVDVTEIQPVLEAAEQAAQDAADAHSAAGEAQSTADAAMDRAEAAETNAKDHADQLPKVLHGTTAPAGNAPDGSIWFQHEGSLSGAVVGQWARTNNAWKSTPITSEAIANLDVGKLTAGSANVAEGVFDKLWANDVAVANLEATQGWVGGVNLADGAVTAEKITATRELITKIMGAEWAYISERLVVDGDLIADNAEIISAALKTLTVTERADFVEAFAKEIYSKESITDALTAGEAWIGGALIKDNTIDVENLNVTERMVGRLAEFLHLVVDRIDANALWADETWQAAGHFGSESADQSTLIDGTGLRITKLAHEDDTETDIVRLGGEGIGLVFADEDGSITGSLSHEGDASFRDVSADQLTLNGRPLLPDTGDPADFWDGNLWDSQPKGLICFHEVDMSGVSVNHDEYGFIEVNHPVYSNRKYRVTTNNFLLSNDGVYQGRFRYTLGDGTDSPHTESVQLGNTWVISQGSNVQARGDHSFTPEHDGVIRILLCVTRAGSATGITFNNNSSFATAQLRLEDLGPDRPYTGMTRSAGHGGSNTFRDPQPIGGATTSEWHASWYQNYSHDGTRQATNHLSHWRHNPGGGGGFGSAGPVQGQHTQSGAGRGLWAALFGFPSAGVSTDPGELGKTLQQALAGADIHSIVFEYQVSGARLDNNLSTFSFGAHPNNTAPTRHPGSGLTIATDQRSRVGETRRLVIPVDGFGALLKTGDFRSIGIRTGSALESYAGWLEWWSLRPKLIVRYTKEGN